MRIALGLGSNLGDRLETLRRAASLVDARFPIVAVSPVYETEPVGGPPQGPYLNAAVLVLAPSSRALFEVTRAVEIELGRERILRWGPRTLDLDILWAEEPTADPDLVVPHPRLYERGFAAVPLFAIVPDLAAGAPAPSFTALSPYAPASALFVPRAG